jgi:hypothetical protein
LKRLHKRKRLSDCLEVLGEKGIHGDEAIFILSNLGGARPRPQPEFINTLL